MRSIAFSAICFLSFAVTGVGFAQGPPGHIFPGSKVVIAPMDGFETYFAAAVREKKVPINLTLDRDSAQYFIVSTETEWRGFVYGSAASASWSQGSGHYTSGAGASSTRGLEASIMLIDAETKDIVWAYEVHKSSHGALVLGTLAARGKQSVAEACAKHLKEFIEKDESTKGSGRSSIVITPITDTPTVKASPSSPTPTSGPPLQSQPSSVLSTVSIGSIPSGADILVDDGFTGNTPSTINIPPGKHVITVKKAGFVDWVRSMNFYSGSITLNAELTHRTTDTAIADTPAIPAGGNEMPVARVSASTSRNPSGWIGISVQNGTDGALVTGVSADGPGAEAGIKVGDVIQALDGRLVKDKNFENAVASLRPGTKIAINYVRDGSAREALVTVGTRTM
ncbi:MAG: PDZ domain-containing protein [Candidatus Acidiferrum sp.]